MRSLSLYSVWGCGLLAFVAFAACDDGDSNSSPGVVYNDTGASTADGATAADTGSSTTPDAAADAGPSEDTATTPDTQPTPDVPVTPPEDTGPAPEGCDRNGFSAAESQFGSPQSGVMVYQARSSSTEPFDLLTIEFYGGPFGGATEAGTYSLDGSNYEDCGNCILIRAACAGQSCEKTFLAEEGDLVVETWEAGGLFKGRLEGVKAYEVTIDGDSYASTRVPGGEVWCLDGTTFEASVPKQPTFEGTTETSCVAAGNGNLVKSNIADVTYKNCNGEDVTLHSAGCGADDTKALHIMATAGWCGVCKQDLQQMASQLGGLITRTAIAEATPGLDMFVILGEDQNGAAVSEAYCQAYATENKIDPAMLLIDHNTEGVQVPLIEPEGYAVTANGLALTWTAINPYLKADDQGNVGAGYPWRAVLRGTNMEYVWSDYFDARTWVQAIEDTIASTP